MRTSDKSAAAYSATSTARRHTCSQTETFCVSFKISGFALHFGVLSYSLIGFYNDGKPKSLIWGGLNQ